MRRMRGACFVFLLGFALLIPLAAQAPGIISTVAGCGPNNLPALAANLSDAFAVKKDLQGNFYIAADASNQVLKVDASGNLTLVAGNCIAGFSGDGGPGSSAELGTPLAAAPDNSGNVFIADDGNDVVRKVDASGTITTVAGMGLQFGFSGDGGPATSAKLFGPSGVALDSSGNLLIADSNNVRIREVCFNPSGCTLLGGGTLAMGNIMTIVGNGTRCMGGNTCGDNGPALSGELNNPVGLFVDHSGNLFITDEFDNRIREVCFNPSGCTLPGGGTLATGNITTVAGNGSMCTNPTASPACGDNGPATSAQFNQATGVAVDATGNIFIADQNDFRIRRVDFTTGIITTFAGNGTQCANPTASPACGDGLAATSAQLAFPTGVDVDSSGNVLIGDRLDNRIRQVDTSNTITSLAGNGNCCFSGEGVIATDAALFDPEGVAVDASGNIFVSDATLNERVRRIDAVTHNITTVAGNGTSGFSGDNGPAKSAELSDPEGLAVDVAGNLFIADADNNVIRRVDSKTQVITAVAGNGTGGFSGDGGLATSAELSFPIGVAVDASGNLFIDDNGNNRIREVFCIAAGTTSCTAPSGFVAGDITTVAGNGTPCANPTASPACGDGGPAISAELNNPSGVALDTAGNIFIGDSGDERIRRVDAKTGVISTVAGNGVRGFMGDNGAATSAELADPTGVFVDTSGNLFIADRDNFVVRRVDASTQIITTVAGNNINGFSGDGGPATSAELSETIGVAVDGSGNLFITDPTNFRVRCVGTCFAVVGAPAVMLSPTMLAFGDQDVGTTSPPQTVTMTNTGTAQLTINSITPSSGFGETNNCGASLAPAGSCAINVTFSPPSPGPTSGAVISVSDNAAGSPQVVTLSGTGVDFSVSASPGSFQVSPGGTATYTVTVTPDSGGFPNAVNLTASGAPAGSTVSFSPAAVTPGGNATPSTLTIMVPASGPTGTGWLPRPPPTSQRRGPLVPGVGWPGVLLGLVLLLSAFAMLKARMIRAMPHPRWRLSSQFALLCVLLLALAGFLASCEGGFPVPPTGPTATNFTVTITGTSSPLQHSTTVTLTVQ